MLVYFARHGESEFNREDRHQFPHVPLSTLGIEQAKVLVKTLAPLKFDQIITSPYERARQTTKIVTDALNAPVIVSTLFRERKQPSAIEGKLGHDEDAQAIKQLIRDNFHNPDYQHSDEENFTALRQRALDAIKYLESLRPQNILVISHGEFIKMLTTCLLFGPKLTSHDYLKIRSWPLANAALTAWQKELPAGNWSLVHWNYIPLLTQ